MRVYRTLLLLYPRSFRLAYGEDMVAVFEQMRRDRSPAALWWRVINDALKSVIVQRMESLMSTSSSRSLTIGGFASLAIAVVALALRGGSPGTFFGLLFAALVAAGVAIALFLKSNASYVEPTQQMHQHWWRYLGASVACLAGANIATELLELDGPWMLLFLSIITGAFLAVLGVVLGVWHAAYRFKAARAS